MIVLGISALPIGTAISPDGTSPSAGGKAGISLIVSGVRDPVYVLESTIVNVTVVDNQGRIQIRYDGTVRFSSTDPYAILPPDYTFTGADAGRHTFGYGMLYFQTVGDQTLKVNDISNPMIYGSQNEITVIEWPKPNTPPVANFTVAYSTPGGTVGVDASSSWDNEDPTSALMVRWNWGDDWIFDTNWTTVKTANHTYSTGGPHYIMLEVMDTGGLTSTAYQNISINMNPPVAAFTVTPTIVSVSSPVRVDASLSSDVEDPYWMLLVRWDWENDGIYDTEWTNYMIAWHQYDIGGSHTIRLQVMDTGGLMGVTTRTIMVDWMVPIAFAGPDQLVNGQQTVYFDGTASCDDLGIGDYTWTAGNDNTTWIVLTGPTSSYSAFAKPDRYVFTLTVTDYVSNLDFDTMVVDFGHTIARSNGGKNSDTAIWTYSPETNGVWRAMTVNHGLASMVYDVYDMTLNGSKVAVMEQRFRFSQLGAYPEGTVLSNPVSMLAGHTYTVKAKPGGHEGTYAAAYDEFTPDIPLRANLSWSAEGLFVVVNPYLSSLPLGYSCRYTVRWGDGTMSTSGDLLQSQYHVYRAPGDYMITLKLMDSSGASNFTTQFVTVSEYHAPTPTIDYRLYDMFEQPWGDWWQWRLKAYKSDIILNNEPHAYTMVYNPDLRNLQGIIYAPYRWNATATDLQSVSVHNPEFMPVLGTQWVNGSSVDMQIQFQYLDNASWYGYWKPVWGTNWNWSYVMDLLMPGQFVDGYYIGTLYTIGLNREAALEWLGMPMAADPTTWWAANGGAYMAEWQRWISHEGNFRLDIWPAYEWPYIDLATMMDLVEEADGRLTLKIAHFNWGYECLINRWLDEADICAHQPYMEDFHLSAHYDDATAFVTYDAVCQYNLHAVRANQTLDGAAWVWEPQRMDYVTYSNPTTGYVSEFNPWETMLYTSWNSGDGLFGSGVGYDCTPGQFDLAEGMTLTIQLPIGNNVIGYSGVGLTTGRTYGAIYELKMGNDSAYENITVRGQMTLGYSMTGLGPDAPNLWNYYSEVNKTLRLFGPMIFDNYRFPNGLLYHGAPWIEFNVVPVV